MKKLLNNIRLFSSVLLNSSLILIIAISVSIAASLPDNTETASEKAVRILQEIDDLYRSTSSFSTITMQVQTKHYTRTVRMEGWSKGKEKSLVQILYPLKEKGTTTLKSGNNIYTYLPKTDRTIRLTSGMMMASWMGSHFTNDDLVKESRLADDYDPIVTFDGERDGLQVIDFTLIPKPDAPVVWGKIILTISAVDHLPLLSLYFDEDAILARTLIFNEIKNLDGRDLPTVLRVVPADKKEEYTELIYENIKFDIELDDSFFSLMQLRRKQ
jgi:outer membrane lipoprotein-sorting protein